MQRQESQPNTGIIASTDWQAMVKDGYDSRPSALLICDNADERDDLAELVEGSGARLLGAFDIRDAMERLDRIAAVRLIVLHIRTESPPVRALMTRIGHLAEMDGTTALLCVPAALIDDAFAALPGSRGSLICAPDKAELAAALAVAIQPATEPSLHDIGRESEAARLQRLSEEVSRIARTLASLSGRSDASPSADTVSALAESARTYAGEPDLDPLRGRPQPPVTAREIRDMLRLRRLRDQFFHGELFADPAWDMLLDLMAARLSGQRVSVSSLCIAAAVPATTALRWIRALTDNGLFLRQADPQDGRRVFIALSDKAAESMSNYFAAARRGGKAMMV